ncbi:MAG: hypothetical protein A3F43_03230 [Gammaproteobacteria bacterium RIFCSPHIGHO2_12_FULL_42_10]|nr:MAG: hypothetical protein A3F43_03230 [Gammaproteobacteria bacterium RIFCSPHIGHO2_12_FULL_42_10]
MFNGDRPIQNVTSDRLNRALFSKYLARSMLDHIEPDSFVVGLYGGWGVGKTSIINLILEELNVAASNMLDSEKPIVLNFSPWSYSGQNELIYSFFRRLSSALRRVEYLENADRIIYLLELYVSFFTHKPVPHILQSKHSLLDRLFFKKHEVVYGWESGRDLTLVKAELNQLLGQQKHKIIIIIDNISRLYPSEIKQIFQIVKSMGDYSNTAYLLAFDKTTVVRSINSLDGSDGEALLEKIIQLPFEIPAILAQDIENILADRLLDIIKLAPEESWRATYWADIYYSSLRYFFENCRDITRFINTLNFSYTRLRDVVNPVDFFALTAIEVFMPEIYCGIRDNKDLFTDFLDHATSFDEVKVQQDKIRCDEILARNQRISHELLLELLLRLFPRLRRIYQPEFSFYYSDASARNLRRLCNPDLFDAYFRLSIQSGQMPQSEFETILALAADANRFNQAVVRLIQDRRIAKFLDLLDGKALLHVPESQMAAIVNALLDNGDSLPERLPGPLSLELSTRVHRIIHTLLQRIKKPNDRLQLMQNAIMHATNSLYIIIQEVLAAEQEHQSEEMVFLPIEFRDFTPEQLAALKHAARQKMAVWAKDGRLAEHPKLLSILNAWCHFGETIACQQFVREMTNEDRGMVTFLRASLALPIEEAMTKYKIDPSWRKYLDEINTLISSQQLEAHAKLLFEDPYFEKLEEQEQLALMIFLDLSNVKTNKIIPKTTI